MRKSVLISNVDISYFALYPAASSAFRGTYPIAQGVVPLHHYLSKRTLNKMDEGWKMRKCASVSTKLPTPVFASDNTLRKFHAWIALFGKRTRTIALRNEITKSYKTIFCPLNSVKLLNMYAS